MLRRCVFIIVCCVSLVGLSGLVLADGEPRDLGEVCFWASPCPGCLAPPGIILRLGVVSFGNGQFVAAGRWEDGSPVNGNARIDGENIVFSLNSSGQNWYSAINMVIDKSQGGGSYTIMTTRFDQGPSSPSHLMFTNTTSLTTCQ
jgi:hypothetical protein